MKSLIRKLLNIAPHITTHAYFIDFLFRKVFRQNSEVTWVIHHSSKIIHPEKIIRGKHVYPGDMVGSYIQAINGIEIGDYTNIGPNVGIISANHDFIDNEKHTRTGPIRIGKHCWIGMGAVILPEVELGDFTIVGANAVVTKSFTQGYCVIAGNPAKVIRQLDPVQCAAFQKSKQ